MLTRRMFGGLLAGATTALGGVKSGTSDFLKHKILRRPYLADEGIPAKPYWLHDAFFIELAECRAPLRIKATQDGNPEPILEVTVVPRPRERLMLLGLHQLRAENPVKITISSSKSFKLKNFEYKFMRPAFKRVDGMIVFHDPLYKPIPESEFHNQGGVHHRVLYGSGKDVGYSWGGAQSQPGNRMTHIVGEDKDIIYDG